MPAATVLRGGGRVTTLEQDPGQDAADGPAAGPERVDELRRALAELTGVLLGSETLEQTLQRVVDLAVRTMTGCTSASVTLVDGDRPCTAVHTDATALAVDAGQYDVGDGPCLDAGRTLRHNRVDLREADERWPAFTARARELGVRSVLAAPLVAGGRGIGSLNLYSSARDGFDALDEAVVDVFTGQASVALANAQLFRAAQQLSLQLTQALGSRALIEQAKGALMVTRGLTEEQAFALLRVRSQRANRKLRDVAAEVLGQARP